MRETIRLAAVIAVAALLAGCGGDTPETDDTVEAGERPVTNEEATRMGEALITNHQAGGADLRVVVRWADGTSAQLAGAIDWANERGRLTTTFSDGPEQAVTEVAFTTEAVFERSPALTELAAEQGIDIEWVVRPPDLERRKLDEVLEVLLALANDRPDNAVLIAQQEGTAWLRTDTAPISETSVDVFRYGATLLWLGKGTSTMWRFESAAADRPLGVDIVDHGARSIDLPTDPVFVGDVTALYSAATGLEL